MGTSMTFRTPGGCCTHWATRTLKGARPLTGFCRWYMDFDLPSAGSTSTYLVRKVMGSNPIGDSDFFSEFI